MTNSVSPMTTAFTSSRLTIIPDPSCGYGAKAAFCLSTTDFSLNLINADCSSSAGHLVRIANQFAVAHTVYSEAHQRNLVTLEYLSCSRSLVEAFIVAQRKEANGVRSHACLCAGCRSTFLSYSALRSHFAKAHALPAIAECEAAAGALWKEFTDSLGGDFFLLASCPRHLVMIPACL